MKQADTSGIMGKLSGMTAQASRKVSIIGAAAGAGIDIVSATRDERGYLSDLAKEYRPEIAERLGVAENQVTEQDYHQVFRENPILAQAKQVSEMGKAVRVINTTIAAGVGILAGFTVSALTRRAQSGGRQADAANIAGGTIATIAAAGAGRIVRQLLHTRNLGAALKETAHSKIMDIKAKQQRGEETTAADIFLVQLALNPDLDAELAHVKGMRFRDMEAEQQMEVLRTEFPNIHAANTEMAALINAKGMRPQQLLFGVVRNAKEEHLPGHGVPGLEPLALEGSGATAASKVLLDELNRGDTIFAEKTGRKDAAQGAGAREKPVSETPPADLTDKPQPEIPEKIAVRVRDDAEQAARAGREEKYSPEKLALQQGKETGGQRGGHAERLGREARPAAQPPSWQESSFTGRVDARRGEEQVHQR